MAGNQLRQTLASSPHLNALSLSRAHCRLIRPLEAWTHPDDLAWLRFCLLRIATNTPHCEYYDETRSRGPFLVQSFRYIVNNVTIYYQTMG